MNDIKFNLNVMSVARNRNRHVTKMLVEDILNKIYTHINISHSESLFRGAADAVGVADAWIGYWEFLPHTYCVCTLLRLLAVRGIAVNSQLKCATCRQRTKCQSLTFSTAYLHKFFLTK